MTTAAVIIGALVVFVGAIIQGSIGFGINLIAAPVIAMVAPRALPGALVLTALPLSAMVALRERTHRDAPSLKWMLLGAVPGTALGAAVATLAPPATLTLIVGIVAVTGVALSLLPWRPKVTPASACSVGLASQTMGTAAAVGGPPVALLFQHHDGPVVRATLGHFFTITGVFSVIGLVLVRDLTPYQVRYAGVLLPAMVTGLLISGPLRHRLDARWLRPTVLVACALAGAGAIVRGLLA